MADKTIGELPGIQDVYDDSLIPVEQQGAAHKMTGKQFRQFGEKTAEIYVNTAVNAAKDAASAQEQAEKAAEKAKTLRDSIDVDYEALERAVKAAAGSAENAAESEAKARQSEEAAKGSETASRESQKAAAESAAQAALSAEAAKSSETAAAESEAASKESETNAKDSETAAELSKDAAAASAASAATSEAAADVFFKTSKSYAVGGTDTRPGEDADNARYYYEQAMRISQGLEGALLPMGTISFEELSIVTKQAGYMYNIRDDFTTDVRFKEGPGYAYAAGTNVYYTADGFWDCLAGTQVVSVNGQTGAVRLTIPEAVRVKGDKETVYRTGDVNLTTTDIGAVAKSGDTMTGALVINKGDWSQIQMPAANGNYAELETNGGYVSLDMREGSGTTDRRSLRVYNAAQNANLSDSLYLFTSVAGTTKTYKLYGEHNKPTPADIGALPNTGGQVTGNVVVTGAVEARTADMSSRIGLQVGSDGRVGLYSASLNKWLLYGLSTGNIVFNGTASNVSGTVAIANGGTGATTAEAARTALGITAENLGLVFKAGDTLTISTGNLSGYVTSSTKALWVTLFLPKPIASGVSSVTVTAWSSTMRGPNGYLNNESGSVDLVSSNLYTISTSVEKKAGVVRLTVTKSSAFTNVSNNQIVNMTMNPLTIKFN